MNRLKYINCYYWLYIVKYNPLWKNIQKDIKKLICSFCIVDPLEDIVSDFKCAQINDHILLIKRNVHRKEATTEYSFEIRGDADDWLQLIQSPKIIQPQPRVVCHSCIDSPNNAEIEFNCNYYNITLCGNCVICKLSDVIDYIQKLFEQNLFMYAVNYNVLRITSGLAGLRYAN